MLEAATALRPRLPDSINHVLIVASAADAMTGSSGPATRSADRVIAEHRPVAVGGVRDLTGASIGQLSRPFDRAVGTRVPAWLNSQRPSRTA